MNGGGQFGARCPVPAGTGAVRCRYCRASLTVTPGERVAHCSQCNCVTRIRRHQRIPAPPAMALGPPCSFPGSRSKKRAVLIGITYANIQSCGQLSGPINDVKLMRQFLCQQLAFPGDSIIMLTDDQRDPFRLPTKDNIRKAMHWLVQGCSYGDSLVFHFSGRGAQVPDDDGDEVDGYDEAICPLDSFQKGPILDDEINQAIVRPLVHGARLHAVVDACNSETVLDLPFLCRPRRGRWEWEDHRPPTGAVKGTSGGHAVLISGYSDGNTNLRQMPAGCAAVGAMTNSFVKAVQCEPYGLTYGRLLCSMKAIMRDGAGACNFSGVQEPTLSSSELFDINCKPFVL